MGQALSYWQVRRQRSRQSVACAIGGEVDGHRGLIVFSRRVAVVLPNLLSNRAGEAARSHPLRGGTEGNVVLHRDAGAGYLHREGGFRLVRVNVIRGDRPPAPRTQRQGAKETRKQKRQTIEQRT